MMAGLLWYRSYMDSLANTSGYYPDIHAGHADRVTELTLDTPYLVRETPEGYNQLELMELVGGSVAWNQPVRVSVSSSTVYGITRTVSGNSVAYLGTATQSTNFSCASINGLVTGHKYYVTLGENVSLPSGCRISVVGGDQRKEAIYSPTTAGLGVHITSGTSVNFAVTPWGCDLTILLGPELADYVYSLEQATAGSGLAWLKKYDLIDDQYHAFSNPTLEHVKTTAHITKDADDNVLDTSQLDSGLVLRGVLKLVNGVLVYEGDTYEPDGTVTRYFDERAYQAGDESLTDAITDGTDTVYKLQTPTTESADPYTAVQDIEEGGTEEFVTGNNVPVGNVSVYRRA